MTNEAKRSEESGSTAELDRMATELAELANSCCFRSDGWEESLRERILEKLKEAIVMEREECAKACEDLTDNGDIFALSIRERSNVQSEGRGPKEQK